MTSLQILAVALGVLLCLRAIAIAYLASIDGIEDRVLVVCEYVLIAATIVLCLGVLGR